MNKKLAIVVIGLFAVGIVGFLAFSTKRQVATQPQNSARQEGSDTKNSIDFSKRFIAYSDENLKNASINGRAVIFFHASWCPLCSEAENDLKAKWGQVPADVTILKTDYDSSKELKTKYGVVSQDTWVQVDGKGNEIAKWNSGGKGLSSLLVNLK